MNSLSALFVAVLACAVLAGCDKTGGDGRPPPRDGSKPVAGLCGVPGGLKMVKVKVVTFTADAVSILVPKKVGISMEKGGLGWELKGLNGKDIVFTKDGVVFKPGQPEGPASSPATGNGDEFVWCFNETKPDLSWKYSIKIVDKAAPAQVWECDPTIVNSESKIDLTEAPIDCKKAS